jgi:hypothetical protein
MTVRGLTGLFAVLGGVHVVMLLVGRFLLLGDTTLLWAWFVLCVLLGATVAAHVGGIRPVRGLLAGLVFLLTWLLGAPVLVGAFSHLLPERPIVLGIALAAQLCVLLPNRTAVAYVWRLLVPVTIDTTVSALVTGDEPPGVWGTASVVASLLLVWLLEISVGQPRVDGEA